MQKKRRKKKSQGNATNSKSINNKIAHHYTTTRKQQQQTFTEYRSSFCFVSKRQEGREAGGEEDNKLSKLNTPSSSPSFGQRCLLLPSGKSHFLRFVFFVVWLMFLWFFFVFFFIVKLYNFSRVNFYSGGQTTVW